MRQFLIDTKDKTYYYDETATTNKPFTKDQFIASGMFEIGSYIKHYDLYASERNYVHKRINGNVYLVLYVHRKSGRQYAKRFVWTDEIERMFTDEDAMWKHNIEYVELIADVSKLKPLPTYEFVKYLDYELEDDNKECGGISYIGETLGDFLADVLDSIKDFSMASINNALIECGIKPIKEVA